MTPQNPSQTSSNAHASLLTPYSLLLTPYSLLPLLLLFTALTLYQSALLPLGEAADETDHYQYLRFVARSGHPPLTAAERREAGFKGGLAPLYYWLAAWPVALVGEQTEPDIRRVDSRPERHIPTDGLGINHVLHTLDEQWPWRGQPLAWHLVRLLSLPLGWVTIIATYALARRLVPRRRLTALGAAAFVAFLPRFVISSAVINDDNLVFALTALLLLVQVILLQSKRPPSVKLMAAFGALFGLSLVTKYFSLILIPEILLTLFFLRRRQKEAAPAGRSVAPFLAFLGALLLTAGPWFLFIAVRFNRIAELGWIAGLAASLGEPQITEGLVGLLSGQVVRPPAATYSLPAWSGLLYRSFWFEFGWMRIFGPAWLYGLFSLFGLLALAGLGDKLRRGGLRRWPVSPAVGMLLGLHLLLFVLVVLARYLLSATIDTGQGRHLYPALPVIALLAALGAIHWSDRLGPGLGRSGYGLLLGGSFLLPALLALLPGLFVLPHYRFLPITGGPVTLPLDRRLDLEIAPGLSLIGYRTPEQAAAGEALPVTLYWQAGREAEQDYLLSLCMQDEQARPVACWRGHFVDGRYPARAWEAGDTLIDTIFIPLPVCYRLEAQPYSLALELWPLDPAQAAPRPLDAPALTHRFSRPQITIRPTDAARDRSQTVDLWLGDRRLTGPAKIGLRQTLSRLTYATATQPPHPPLTLASTPPQTWPPLPAFETALHLPCADGPTPFAHLSHFIAPPALPDGRYRAGPDQPPVQSQQRDRVFAPLTATLTFSHTLAPLELSLPEEGGQRVSTVDLQTPAAPAPAPLPLQLPRSVYPVTLRWQTHRWMAEPLVIALKLLDKDFAVAGERVATLGDRYPNVLWGPGELVEETYPLRLPPDAPPGLYRLEIGLLRPDERRTEGYRQLPLATAAGPAGENLYPLTLRLLDPAHAAPPSEPFAAAVGPAIRLVGYDVTPRFADSPPGLALALYWETSAAPEADYTVFTQLLGPDGQVWAQWDNPPQAGRYPTSAWRAGDRVVDRYRLTLREGAPPGPYRLLVGMYHPASGERLPATIAGQPQPANALELTTLTLPE